MNKVIIALGTISIFATIGTALEKRESPTSLALLEKQEFLCKNKKDTEACIAVGDTYSASNPPIKNKMEATPYRAMFSPSTAYTFYQIACKLENPIGCVREYEIYRNNILSSKKRLPTEAEEKKLQQLAIKACDKDIGKGCYYVAYGYDNFKQYKNEIKFKIYLEKGCKLKDNLSCRYYNKIFPN